MWDFTKPQLLVDISHYQHVPSTAALHAGGVAGRIAKVNQGTYVDPNWYANRDTALAGGELFGGYLYLDNRVNATAQADTFVDALGANASKIALFIDHEKTSYVGRGTWASWGQCVEAVHRIRQRLGNRVIGLYTYRYFWVNEMGNPNFAALGNTVLWDALYLPGNPHAAPTSLLRSVTPTAFNSFAGFDLSHRAVRQFGSNGSVAGMSPVDVDVFYGAAGDWSNTFGLAGGIPGPPVVRVLRMGDKGADVAAVQGRLNTWHDADKAGLLAADGDFGPATDARVKDFQTKHHLAADGVVGPATRAQLAVVPPAPKPPTPPTPKPPAPSPVVTRSSDVFKVIYQGYQFMVGGFGWFHVTGNDMYPKDGAWTDLKPLPLTDNQYAVLYRKLGKPEMCPGRTAPVPVDATPPAAS